METQEAEKRCPSCTETQPLSKFHRNAKTATGRAAYCKACIKIRSATWYQANTDMAKRNAARWQAANPESAKAKVEKYRHTAKAKATKTAWSDTNRERTRAHNRAAYAADPERYRAAAQSAYERLKADNPEVIRERARRYRRANWVKVKEVQRRHYVAKRNIQALKITPEQVAMKMAYWGSRCWMCHGPFEHIDHVKPISKGGAHMLCNLRPACQRCNQSKGGKWPWPTTSRMAA